jgi:hypothetical protein
MDAPGRRRLAATGTQDCKFHMDERKYGDYGTGYVDVLLKLS